MSTNPIYAFEHAPTGTIVRAHHHGNRLQVLRRAADQRLGQVACFDAHQNHQLGYADGVLAFPDARGRAQLLDLRALEDGPRPAPRGLRALLDAARGLVLADPRFPYEAPDGAAATGLLVVSTADGRVLERWAGLDGDVATIEPFGRSSRSRRPFGTLAEDSFEIVVAGDRQTWALVAAQRVVIGRGAETFARLEWTGPQVFPPMASLDLSRRRLLLCARVGVAAVSFDGTVEASWLPAGQAKPLSPALVEGDELLVVVAEPGAPGEACWTRVVRLDAGTLRPLGDHAIGRLRDPGDQAALLRLADGSLAWVPRSLPLRIASSEGAGLRTSEHAQIVGDEPAVLVPEPTDAWYEPTIGREGALALADVAGADDGQRRSLARFLLEQRAPDPRWRELLLRDPTAFSHHADHIVRFGDADLLRLRDAEPRLSPWTAWHASDDAVDALVAAIGAGIPSQGRLPPVVEHRVRLLAHVHTPHALEAAGRLARDEPRARIVLADELVEAPSQGPARVRYVVEARDLFAVAEGKASPDTPAAVDGLRSGERFVRGPTCALPLVEVLRVAPPLLTGAPGWTFFVSRCEACDESLTSRYELSWDDGQPRLVVPAGHGDGDGECEGHADVADEPIRVWMGHYQQPSGRARHAGRLGGRPPWLQFPEPASCTGCTRMMLYVGHVRAAAIRSDVPDVTLYGFWCEGCERATQVMQMT